MDNKNLIRNQYIEFLKGEKHPGKEKHITYNLDELEDAGYVIKKDEIILDIDDLPHETIFRLLDEFNIKTETRVTERGVHLYFKRPPRYKAPKTGITALGFKAEYKVKTRDHWVTIKRGGVTRKVLNEGVRETLPQILIPVSKYENLLGIADGDGRNAALYKHKHLISSLEDKDHILEFINNNIFDTPLPEKEFETTIREEHTRDFENREVETARSIINESGIILYNNEFYYINDQGNHQVIDQNNLKRLIACFAEGASSRIIDEIAKQIAFLCPMISDNKKVFPIKFENGFLVKGRFHEADSDFFTPYYIRSNYIEDAKPVQVVDDYLNFISHDDPKYRLLIEEIIGYCFNTDPVFNQFHRKFFILYGTGSNGKGTFLRIVEKIMGTQNCSFLSHSQMGERFGLDNMIGKLVNISDDIPDKPFNDEILKMIKNITSSDPIQIDKKNSQPLKRVILTTTLLMSSNHYIKSFEKGESFKNRVVWLPVDRRPEKFDPHLIDKLTTPEAIEYWVSLAVKGYMRLYKNESFTSCELIEKFNEQYHHDNNNTLEFCSQLTTGQIINKKQCEILDMYNSWCEENGETVHNKKILKATLEDAGFQFIKKGTKRVWRQVKEGVRYDPFTKKRIEENIQEEI